MVQFRCGPSKVEIGWPLWSYLVSRLNYILIRKEGCFLSGQGCFVLEAAFAGTLPSPNRIQSLS